MVPSGNGKSPAQEVPISTESAVGQTILRAIGDPFSLRMLEAVVDEGKSIEEICVAESIPVSTAYRRVHEFTEGGLITYERIVVTGSGKKYMIYRATFSRIRVEFGSQGPRIMCVPNGGIPDIAFRVWQLARR